MKIFIKHIMRNLEDNIVRTLLMFVTLFGIGFMVSMILSFMVYMGDFAKLMVSSNPYDFIIYNTNSDNNFNYDSMSNLRNDFSYLGLRSTEIGYIYKNDEYMEIDYTAFDMNKAMEQKLINYEGFSLSDNEVIIDSTFAKLHNINLNDEIEYYTLNKDRYVLKVKYLSNDSLSDIGSFIFLNEDLYKKLNNNDNDNKYSFFLAKYDGNEKISKIYDELINVEYDYELNVVKLSDFNAVSDLSSSFKIISILILLVLIVAYFILNSIVKVIMNERIPVVGSFRSVGASKIKMSLILIMEQGCYGFISGIFGAILASSFIGAIFNIIYSSLSITIGVDAVPSYSYYSFLIIFFTGVLLFLFQIILSLNEILNFNTMSIKDCMFSVHDFKFKRNKAKLIIGLIFLVIGVGSVYFRYSLNFYFGVFAILSIFISLTLLLPFITKLFEKIFVKGVKPLLSIAFNNINENKLQVGTNIIITVLISISILIGSALNYYIKLNNSKIKEFNSDIYVSSSYESLNTFNDILSIENVNEIASLYYGSISYDSITFANNKLHNNESINFIYSENPILLKNMYNVFDIDFEKWSNLKNNEIIVSNYYKDKYGLKVGDLIILDLETKAKRFSYDVAYEFVIVDFANTDIISNGSIIVSRDIFYREASSDHQYYFINVNDVQKIKETKNDISKLLVSDYKEINTKEEYLNNLKDENNGLYKTIVTIVLLIVLFCLLGIINNQTVAFLRRTKEFAILYSTCMNKNQLCKMVFKEMSISYLISIFIALPISYILCKLMYYTIDDLNVLYLPFKFNMLLNLGLFIILVLILFIIYFVIALKIKKLNIVEELKYE